MRNRAIYASSGPGKLLLSFIFFMLGMGGAHAQQMITVTGKITSADNTPLGGVTVVVTIHRRRREIRRMEERHARIQGCAGGCGAS